MPRSWLAPWETVNNEFTLDVSHSCLLRWKLWDMNIPVWYHWHSMLKAPKAPGSSEHRLVESNFHSPKCQSQVRLALSVTE